MTTPRLGMPSLLECASLADDAALCARLGLDFVELNMNQPEFAPGRLDAAKCAAAAREWGVDLSLHLDERLDPCDFNPHVRAAAIATVREALAFARAVGVRTATMHWSEGVYFTLPNEKPYLYALYRDEYLRAARALRDAATEAAGGEVLLCVENTGGWRPFQREAIDLLLDSPAFTLCWDTGHDHAAGGVDRPFLLERRGRIAHMHLHDALGGQNHLPPGDGEIDIPARLAFARDHGIACVLEVKTAAALEQAAAYCARYMDETE